MTHHQVGVAPANNTLEELTIIITIIAHHYQRYC